MKPIALLVALAALTSTAHADSLWDKFRLDHRLYRQYWSQPVSSFFAANGQPTKSWGTVGGVAGIGSQYRWVRGSCEVLIRTTPDDTIANITSYGSCQGVVQ